MKRTDVIAVGASTLLVVDLFLPWQRIGVAMPHFGVDVTSSGWGGWGTAAGICALTLIVLALVAREPSATARAIVAVLLPVFAALAAFSGDVHVGTHMTNVQVNDTLWAAWVGLALAIVAAGATLAPLVSRPAERSRPHPA